MAFEEIARRLAKLTADNSPMLLTGFAVAGTITTAVLTGKAAVKAHEILREEEERWKTTDLEPKYKVQVTWKLFLPPVASGAITIACIIAANQIGARRAAAIAAAYSLSERAYSEYREKVVEKVGQRKEQTYRDEIVQDRVNETPPSREIIIASGEVLCYDKFTGRYFTSSVEELKSAQNAINHQINNDYYASLTDFYNRVGLRPTGISDEMGWNSDKLLELTFSSVLADDGRPCLAVDFAVTPIRGYYRVS